MIKLYFIFLYLFNELKPVFSLDKIYEYINLCSKIASLQMELSLKKKIKKVIPDDEIKFIEDEINKKMKKLKLLELQIKYRL